MIESLVKGFSAIAKKPVALLPAVAFAGLSIVLFMLVQEPLANFVVDALIAGEIPETGLIAFPLHFAAMYPAGLASVVVLWFVSTLLWIASAFVYARIANDLEAGHASVPKAVQAAVGAAANIFWLTVFMAVIAVFFFILSWILMVLAAVVPVLTIVVLLLQVLIMLGLGYVYVKLAFSVQAMAVEGLKPKDALAKSWAFTTKRFWRVVLFMLAVVVITLLVFQIGDIVELMIPSEEIGIIAFMAIWAVGVSFSSMAIEFYFIKNEVAKSG